MLFKAIELRYQFFCSNEQIHYMVKILKIVLIFVVLASCGGGAPLDMSNACNILREKPHFYRAFRAAERNWLVPMAVQMAVIYQESKFIWNARTPRQYTLGVIPRGRQSSAYGYAQALDGTWKEYQKDQRRFGARRNRIDDAADFMGWYMAETNRILGIRLSDAKRQYLAYHQGRTGYKRGSHNRQKWLLDVSSKVGSRSVRYNQQLKSCKL
jgi:hypothetical protein